MKITRKRRHEAMLEQGMHSGNTDAKFDPPPAPNAKPTKAQRELLKTIPDEFERFQRRRGIPYLVANPTIRALVNKGLIEILTVPPRWRRTPAGRVAVFTISPARSPQENV